MINAIDLTITIFIQGLTFLFTAPLMEGVTIGSTLIVGAIICFIIGFFLNVKRGDSDE